MRKTSKLVLISALVVAGTSMTALSQEVNWLHFGVNAQKLQLNWLHFGVNAQKLQLNSFDSRILISDTWRQPAISTQLQSLDNLKSKNKVTLQILPETVLLTRKGETKSLTVRAMDANLQEISTKDLALEWGFCNKSEFKVANSKIPNTITVTAQADVGFTRVIARSTNRSLVSPIVNVTIAQVKKGVQLIPDARVVYPPVNLPPGVVPANYPLRDISLPDASGKVQIGTFKDTEVGALYEANREKLSLKFPVVLRGKAPVVGSWVLANEGAGFAGQVLQVKTRGQFSLVQIQLPSSLGNIYTKLGSTTECKL